MPFDEPVIILRTIIFKNFIMKKAILTFIGLFMLGLGFSYAHAIWIETSAQGQKGTAQEVKVYFGEFGTEEISQTSEWFADLSQFELQLLAPDGNTTTLPFKDGKDHFFASFTPEQEGLYKVVLHKIASEVYYGYKLDYMAAAHVQVGSSSSDFSQQLLPITLQPQTGSYITGKPIDLSVLVNQELKGDKEITVISPNTWTKKLYTNDQSSTRFTPLWPGKYLIETTLTDKNKGTFNGKEYTVDYHCHTYVLEVK
ncbi:hypothetical protein GCM10027566_23970 [Arachidicoccus ginsenosidivorans]